MASTRDINSTENYKLEQRALDNISNNISYNNAPNGHAYNPALPVSYMAGRMPADNFSHNPIDIESVLFGIGSTNLVTPKPAVFPQLKQIDNVSFFERQQLIIPANVYRDDTQRPSII